jgi:hypothetical protein
MGTYPGNNMEQIWRYSPLLRELRRSLEAPPEGICSKCVHWRSCRGKCVMENYVVGGCFSAPHLFCGTARKWGCSPWEGSMDSARSILKPSSWPWAPGGRWCTGRRWPGRRFGPDAGPSDGGKTTAAYNLAGLGWRLIGDDSVVVAQGTDGVVRTLPCGSHRMRTGRYMIAPAVLRGLVFLEKGREMVLPVAPDYGFYRAERTGWLMARDIVPRSVLLEARGFLDYLLRKFPAAVYRTGPRDSGERLLEWLISL